MLLLLYLKGFLPRSTSVLTCSLKEVKAIRVKRGLQLGSWPSIRSTHKKIAELSWGLAFLFSPLSLDLLPQWASNLDKNEGIF